MPPVTNLVDVFVTIYEEEEMKIIGIRKYNNMVWLSFVWIKDVSCGYPQPNFVKQWKPLP